MIDLRGVDIRRIVLEQSRRANVGHIGSSLSIADIVAALYSGGMQIESPDHPNRDRFILSKGHAVLAVYAALHLRGWMTADALNSYCADGTLLGVHPENELRGIDFSTGSLGQGLSVGVGAAVAAVLDGSNRRAIVLLSDAECNEGSVWEAVMFASHRRLSNLVAIVDLNGQQALGYSRDVLDLSPLRERWQAFGWDVSEVDGHDVDALRAAIAAPGGVSPRVILARTVFGKGVSYMESQIKWHYWPMSDTDFAQAMSEIESHP